MATSYKRVTPLLRPPRIAVGVHSDLNIERWSVLIMRSCALWGGLGSTIYFPLGEWEIGSIWDNLIRHFDPDLILCAQPTFPLAETFEDLYCPIRILPDPYLYSGIGPVVGAASASLSSVLRLPLPAKPAGATLCRNQPATLPIELLMQRTIGALTPQDRDSIDDAGLTLSEVPFDLSNATSIADTVRLAVHGSDHSLRDANRLGLQGISLAAELPANRPVVVCGTATADICLWLTLLACRNSNDVWWITAEAIEGYTTDAMSKRWLREIALAITHAPLRPGDSTVVVTSTSLTTPTLVGAIHGLHTSGPAIVATTSHDIWNDRGSRVFMSVNRHEGTYIESFTDGVAAGMTRPQWPRWLDSSPQVGLRMLTEIHVEGFLAPTHRGVLPLLDGRFSESQQRASRYGIVADLNSILTWSADELHHVIQPVQIALPDDDVIFERLARRAGGAARPSSAGRLQRELVDRFGGIVDAASALQTGPLRTVLDEFLQPVDKKHRISGKLELESRWVISSSAFDKLLSGLAKSPEALLRRWTEQRIVEWGLALDCSSCQHSAFFRWDELARLHATCKRCGRSFVITTTSLAKWWPVARLDELVYQALKQDAAEEIQLASRLAGGARYRHVSLGVEWSLSGLAVESDVAAVLDGELVFAEAKSTDEFSKPSQPKRLGELADRLHARALEFATSRNAWSAAALSLIQEVAKERPHIAIRSITGLGTSAPVVVVVAPSSAL